jgi:hypothetical protein
MLEAEGGEDNSVNVERTNRQVRARSLLTMTLACATASACGKDDPPADAGTTGSSGGAIELDEGPDKLDIGGGGASLDSSGGNPDGLTSGCGEVSVVVTPTTPTLVLLVDQSGSMTEDFDGVERWDALYDTLMDPADGVVANLEGSIRFGLTLYTSEDGFEGGECPMLTSVGPALDNLGAIDAVYGQEQPVDETPTGESLAAVAQELAMFDEPGPKGIVLATDGQPDTCDEPNPQNGEPESTAAAQQAFDLGIKVFVLSVGPEVAQDHLQEMANIGIGKAPDDPMPAPYWQALNPQQLVDAFSEIIGSFVSCNLEVNGIVDLDKACDGTVMLDGVALECGTDWQMPDESTLELLGDACTTLQDGGEHNVSASWPCGAVQIP